MGEDWKVHKATGKVTVNGSEVIGGIGWTKLPNVTPNTYYLDSYIRAKRTDSTNPYFAITFGIPADLNLYVDLSFFLNLSSRHSDYLWCIPSVGDPSWLAEHPTTLYYARHSGEPTPSITRYNSYRTARGNPHGFAFRTAQTPSRTPPQAESSQAIWKLATTATTLAIRYDKWLWLDLTTTTSKLGR